LNAAAADEACILVLLLSDLRLTIAGIYANRIRPDKPETKVIIAAPAVSEAFLSNFPPLV
jgi:hypothetical protein